MGYLKVKRNICPFSKYRKTLHEHPKYILCSFSWCKRIRQNGTSGFLRSATYNFITFLLQEFLPFKNTVYSVRKLGLATANKQSLYNFFLICFCSCFLYSYCLTELAQLIFFFFLMNKKHFYALALRGTVYRREQHVAV